MSQNLRLHIAEELHARGWAMMIVDASNPADQEAELVRLASGIGVVVATRGDRAVDELRPVIQRNARRGSMSAHCGTYEQPWHMDMAHRPSPARYILMSCREVGEKDCETDLLDWRKVLDGDERSTAAQQEVLVRSGKSSFYSTLVDRRLRFIRQDPSCIRCMTPLGRAIQEKISDVAHPPHVRVCWSRGVTLIFDNWRFLHRRGDASLSISRSILRVSIMANSHDRE